MSRELKFRAWDKDSKRFIPAKELIIGAWPIEHSEAIEFSIEPEDDEGHPTKPYILMRYTGVTDANGIEIYEGDIVRWDYFKKQVKASVGFDRGMFVAIFEGNAPPLNEYLHQNLEVIGNIWENAELLEDKNV